MCDGDGTAMCGEPRVAAECTCTACEFGRCARPTVRPGRNVNDKRDHGDGSSTRPRGRRTSGSLTETRVRDWQYWSALVAADRTMNPCPLDGTDQLARHVLAACIEPDGPVDADGDQALVIVDARHPAFLPGGEAARPWDAATGALVRRPRRRRCSWPRLVAPRSRDRRPGRPWRRVDVGADHAGTYGLEVAPWWSNAGRVPLPLPCWTAHTGGSWGSFPQHPAIPWSCPRKNREIPNRTRHPADHAEPAHRTA